MAVHRRRRRARIAHWPDPSNPAPIRPFAPDELRRWEVKPGSLADGTAAGWPNGFKDANGLEFPLFIDTTDSAVELPMWDANADKLGLGPLAINAKSTPLFEENIRANVNVLEAESEQHLGRR